MNTIKNEQRIINTLNFPIAFCGVIYAALFIISLFNLSYKNTIIPMAWSTLVGGFMSSGLLLNSKKTAGFTAGFTLMGLVYYAVSGSTMGFLFTVGMAYLLLLVCKSFEYDKIFYSSALISVVIGLFLGLVYEPALKLVVALAESVENKSFVFGIVDDVYSLLFSDVLRELFYYKDYGGALIIDNKLFSGALNIFLYTKNEPASFVAKFLTGRYFSNIFLPVGVFLALFSRVRDKYQISFCSSVLISILLGNNVFLSLFLSLYNPFIYFAYLLCIGIDYILCSIIDIRVGFSVSANVFEMIRFIDKPVYFILIGLLSSVLMYFAVTLVLSKYDFDTHKIPPRNIRNMIKYLGGEKNIVELEQGIVYVKNPNLINILQIDCLINENAVTLNSEDYDLLKKYYD